MARPKPTVFLILLLGGLSAFGPLSIDLYLPALPAIGMAIGADGATMQQTLAAFLIGISLGQLFYGPLSDRIGRRPPILFGIAVYTVASLLCVFAETGGQMIGLRFVQGLGSCAALVIARAVVRDRFDHQDTARIFSWIVLVMGLAPIFAPLVGSLILAISHWQVIFWALAAYGALIGLWVYLGLPESRSDDTRQAAGESGFFGGMIVLMKTPQFRGYTFGQAFNMASLFAYVASAPAILITQYGVSEAMFGWLFGINAAGLIAGSQVNRYLLDHFHADTIMRNANRLAVLAGIVLVAIAFSGFGGLVGLMVALFLVLATYAFIAGNANAGGLSVDPRRAGAASALLGATGFGVGAASAAITGALPLPASQATAIVSLTSLVISWWVFRAALRPQAHLAAV
ncbi:MAG: multidrug effflux MFS transporter [Pacificimonas sp.]